MKKYLFPIVLAIPLALAACGQTEAEEPPAESVTVVETVTETSTVKSKEKELEDLNKAINSQLPMYDVTAENLERECIMAIHAKMPDAGDYDCPTPIDFGDIDPDAGAHTAGGKFLYEDENDVWTEGAYFCSVFSEGGTITDASATAI